MRPEFGIALILFPTELGTNKCVPYRIWVRSIQKTPLCPPQRGGLGTNKCVPYRKLPPAPLKEGGEERINAFPTEIFQKIK